ncbi:hypothetical protein BKA65DRAFT_68013 [Rhexocercosporidium sp. MPI-PUGE-AT-0058]|nr:hypothetical protein BKA65DRAFT_68013 [Rhexocercosporidium sp. MPI-PUGE-AT-0058]
MTTGVGFEDLQKFIAETKTPSLVSSSTATISSLAKECVKRYDLLCAALRETPTEVATANGFVRDDVLIRIQDAWPRFKAWATNIAALQEGHMKSSLDFRLREATEIRSRVLKILESLKESLNSAHLIVTGERGNKTWEVGAMSESSFSSDFGSEVSWEESDAGSVNEKLETSELNELLSAIKTANSSLMDISIVIRNTPTRDDYVKAAARYSLDSHWDVSHVDAKFGSAKRSSDWLIQRLGKSITRRRQYLTYRKEHHDKLSKDWDEPPKEVIMLDKEEKEAPPTVALTKATTYVEGLPAPPKDGSEVGSFETETSYQQTVAGDIEDHLLTVPPPPAEAFEGVPFEFGHPFQCPYCWTEQNVKSRNAWKKHVFRDLRPYVCTFKECNLRMFRSRNEWFAHELQAHRREWTCATCSKLFASKSSFKSHLLWHYPAMAGSELDALILQSEEPMDRFPASACLICDEWEAQIMNPNRNEKRALLNDGKDVEPYGTKTQFRRHLGRHMEQLALFALPRDNLDDVEDDSEREIPGEVHDDDSNASTGTTVSKHSAEITDIANWIQGELVRIRKEFPGVDLNVPSWDSKGRRVDARLSGPWGAEGTMAPIRATFVFPDQFPLLEVPSVSLGSEKVEHEIGYIIPGRLLFLEHKVNEVVESFAAQPRDCLEGVLRYLLGEADFENGKLVFKKGTAASDDHPKADDIAGISIAGLILHREIIRTRRKRPEVAFDEIDLDNLRVVATLKMPWGSAEGDTIILEISFPKEYPTSGRPKLSTNLAPWPALHHGRFCRDIEHDLYKIAEACVSRNHGCLDNLFAYIMAEENVENSEILHGEATSLNADEWGETSDDASEDDDESLVSRPVSRNSNAAESQENADSWQDEVNRVQNQLPHMDIKVNLEKRSITAVLRGFYGGEGVAAQLTLDIFFPYGYPVLEAPVFTRRPSWKGDAQGPGKVDHDIINIAAAYLKRKQGCLEAVFSHLLSEMDRQVANSSKNSNSFDTQGQVESEIQDEGIAETSESTFHGPPVVVKGVNTTSTQARRFNCSFEGCPSHFGRKADAVRHEQEAHKPLKHCPVEGCLFKGTKRMSQLDKHIAKRHPNIGKLSVPSDFNSLISATMPPEDPSVSLKEGLLPEVIDSRPKYYDYAAEKSMNHADAKLFHHGSQLNFEQTGWNGDDQSHSPQPEVAIKDGNNPSRYLMGSGTVPLISSTVPEKDGELLRQYKSIGMPSNDTTMENNTTIFVGFYDTTITEDDLVALFINFGDIVGVRVPNNRNFAYVKFLCREDAEIAVKHMNGHLINGNQLLVDFAATQRAKESIPTAEGALAEESTLSPELQTTLDRVIEGREMSKEDWAKWALDPTRKDIQSTIEHPTAETSQPSPEDGNSTGKMTVPIPEQIYVRELTVDTPEYAIMNPGAPIHAIEEYNLAQPTSEWRSGNESSRAALGNESYAPGKQFAIADTQPYQPLAHHSPLVRHGKEAAVDVDTIETVDQPQSEPKRDTEKNIKNLEVWAASLEGYKDVLRDELKREELLAAKDCESMLRDMGLIFTKDYQARVQQRTATDKWAALEEFDTVSQSALASAAVASDRMIWEETLERTRSIIVSRFRFAQIRFRAKMRAEEEEIAAAIETATTNSEASLEGIFGDSSNDAEHLSLPTSVMQNKGTVDSEATIEPTETDADAAEDVVAELKRDIDREIRAAAARYVPMDLMNPESVFTFLRKKADWKRRLEMRKERAVAVLSWRLQPENRGFISKNSIADNRRTKDTALRNFVNSLKLEETQLAKDFADCGQASQNPSRAKSQGEDTIEAAEAEVEEETHPSFLEPSKGLPRVGRISRSREGKDTAMSIAKQSLSEKQLLDERAEKTTSRATDQQPTTSTQEAKERAAWEAKLESAKLLWFMTFDQEIEMARKPLLEVDESSESKTDKVYTWQKGANELRIRARKIYRVAHDSALKAGRDSPLTDADRKVWEIDRQLTR